MKTLYLHIGTPKTATTAIQDFCNGNQVILNQKGYSYPIIQYQYNNIRLVRNAQFLIGKTYKEDGTEDIQAQEKVWQEGFAVIQEEFTKYDNVILSDEGIWNGVYTRKKDLWKLLKQESKKGKFRIVVIVYLRRQDKFAFSWWNQQIKVGMNSYAIFTWEEFLKHSKNVQFDYYKVLNDIAKELGKENICVRRFDTQAFKGTQHTIYSDFLENIGLEWTPEFQIAVEKPNLSLTGNTQEIKRILNTLDDLNKQDHLFFRKSLIKCNELSNPKYKYNIFSKEENESFLSKYDEGNRKIAQEYLHEEGELFSMEVPDISKWEEDNPYMYEDVIRFIGESTKTLFRVNQCLNQELKSQNKKIASQNKKIESQNKKIASQNKKIESQSKKLEKQNQQFQQLSKKVEKQEKDMQILKEKLKHPFKTLKDKLI